MSKNYLAKYYSKLILPLKPEVLTEQENALIQTMLPEYGNILDVGCGAGRHFIPLSQMGYQVVGVESNKEMSAQLMKEMPAAKLFIGDINSQSLREEIISNYQNYFDLIILMWNTLNELAYSEAELINLLQFFKTLVKESGKVLIQIDQNVIGNPEVLNFTTKYTDPNSESFTYSSKLVSWDEKDHISVCKEKLETSKEIIFGEVKQKWWSFAELSQHKDIIDISMI